MSGQPEWDDEDEGEEIFSSHFDAQVNSDDYKQPPPRRDRGGDSPPNSPPPSPLRSPRRPLGPPPPVPLAPGVPGPLAQGGDDLFAPSEDYVVLDNVRRRRTDVEENDEELGRWATLLRRTMHQPTPRDVDFSDDEYEPDELPQRLQIDAAASTDPRDRMRLLLGAYPELHDELSVRLSGLQLDEFRKGVGELMTEENAWFEFCRLKDRRWCFPCAHRAGYEQRDYTAGYNMIMAYLTDYRKMEFNFARVERIVQDIYFTKVRPYMPPRRNCNVTGRAKPPHYWWRSMVREHLTNHVLLPVQAEMRMVRQYELISYSIKTRMVARIDRGRDTYAVDSKMLSDALKADLFIMKLHDSIAAKMAASGSGGAR